MALQQPGISNLDTEQQHTDSFNKVVLESSPDCLKILDTAGRLQYMNFNGLCQMEIDDFSVFKNQLWWDLWGEENAHFVKDAVDVALTDKATEFTALCSTAKGTPKWWHVTVTPIASSTNDVYQLLSVSRDITDAKKAEAEIMNLNNSLEEKVKLRTGELLEKNKELEKINKDLAVFNHITSHDLQEPLRKIQMYSNLMLDAESDASKVPGYLARIIRATDRMRNLISSLKEFSVSKNAQIEFVDCDLNEIVLTIIEDFKDTLETQQVHINVEALPVVDGSRILLTQLFINLIDNALKYHRNDVPPQISFSYKTVEATQLNNAIKTESDQFYAVQVADNGIGFKNEYKDQIFEVFQRLHSKDKFSGTGMGLAICKTISENHGGWIEATGAPEVGSTFTVYFPKK